MSMYPPGVTGREPQIAGMAEQRVYVECKATTDMPMFWADSRFSVEHAVDRMEAALSGWQPGEDPPHDEAVWQWAAAVVKRWKEAKELEFMVGVDCSFEGEVDAQVDDELAYADCPQCGADIEYVHGLFDEDPDAGRDE